MTTPTFMFLHGGLGDQLFQVAAGYAHAKRNGYDLRMPGVPAGQRQVTYWHSWLWQFSRSISPPMIGELYAEQGPAYVPIPPTARTLRGFFRSSRHFSNVADELRQKLTLHDDMKAAIQTKWSELLEQAPNMALVHIRCLDGLTMEYYERAVARLTALQPNVKLAVISNDLAACREQPWLADATFIEEYDESVALYLMSHFKHFVISNTSLMWWAVWLSGTTGTGTVIAPATASKDIYEPDWLQEPVGV